MKAALAVQGHAGGRQGVAGLHVPGHDVELAAIFLDADYLAVCGIDL